MTACERLPSRRASTTFAFTCGKHRYIASISMFPGTDRLAESFLGNGRAGSDVDSAAKDSAIVASLALQHGTPVDTIRKALLRDGQGAASSPLGTALDLVAAIARRRIEGPSPDLLLWAGLEAVPRPEAFAPKKLVQMATGIWRVSMDARHAVGSTKETPSDQCAVAVEEISEDAGWLPRDASSSTSSTPDEVLL